MTQHYKSKGPLSTPTNPGKYPCGDQPAPNLPRRPLCFCPRITSRLCGFFSGHKIHKILFLVPLNSHFTNTHDCQPSHPTLKLPLCICIFHEINLKLFRFFPMWSLAVQFTSITKSLSFFLVYPLNCTISSPIASKTVLPIIP